MKALTPVLALTVAFCCSTLAAPARATDQDPGSDCVKDLIEDWGDAPEGVLAYPGTVGKFPTCRAMNLVGDQQIAGACPPISSPPGPSGHIFHRQGTNFSVPSYWLGCHLDPAGAPIGIDSEAEGKVNQPAQGVSFCRSDQPTDCVENAFGLAWDQDECTGDGSDAGLAAPPMLTTCQQATLTFSTYNCGSQERVVHLNILIDMNRDGDWNDVLECTEDGATTCAYEWAVKNAPITLPPGCGSITSPGFLVGPNPGPSWLRISLTDDPATDNYPWAGGAGHSGFRGGETEDYPVMIEQEVPAQSSSWGEVKARYR